MTKKGVITSITVPIDYSIMGGFELRRLTQIVKRDTHIINKYLGIIQYNQKYLLGFKKGQYAGKLDELTLSTRYGRKPKHDIKKMFPRISHNELLECRDSALGLFKSYIELSKDTGNSNTQFPRISNQTGRQVNSRRWKHDAENRTVKILDSMDSNPKMIKLGKNVTRHDWIDIPLRLSQYHLSEMNLGSVRTIQLVTTIDKRGKVVLSVKFSILHDVNQLAKKKSLTKPVGVIGVDLGINIDITTAFVTSKGVVEYKTFKVDQNIKNSIIKKENTLKHLQQSSQIREYTKFVEVYNDRRDKLISLLQSNKFNLQLDKSSSHQLRVIGDKLTQIRNSFKFNHSPTLLKEIKVKSQIIQSTKLTILPKLLNNVNTINQTFESNFNNICKEDKQELSRIRKATINLIQSIEATFLLLTPNKLYNTDSIYKKLRELKNSRKRLSIDADRKLSLQFSQYVEDLSKDYDIYISIGKLKGIRNRSRRGNGNKYLRKLVNRWTFFRITNMIQVKMAKLGLSKRVLVISEAWTSKTCWKCNTRGKRLRQNLFQCINTKCEWKYNADVNGAINIAKRLIAKFKLTSFRNRGVRGLGKYLPVTSSKKKRNGKDRSVPKNHNGRPSLLFGKTNNGNAGTQSNHPSLDDFFENDQPVVKNHGKTDFVETSKKRSRKKHRSNGTEPISTEANLEINHVINKKVKVMATSDIGLQNAKNRYSNKNNS